MFSFLIRRHWIVVPLLVAGAAASLTGQVILEPRIVSETLPSGGLMQIKMELTAPHPILVGNAQFDLSDSFEGFEGASLFSPSGDAYGVAFLRGRTLVANIVSPQQFLGTQLDYPFLVIASKIQAGIPTGTKIPINFNSATVFNGPGLQPYAYVVRDGTLTIGGSVSVTNVIPGGGVLPAGTTVRILGTGFSTTTQLKPGTLSISNFRYISPNEVRFDMAQSGDITGQRLILKNPSNNDEATYFSYLRPARAGASARALLNGADPMFQPATFTSAALTVPSALAGGYVGLSIQNGTLAGTSVNMYLVSAGGAVIASASQVLGGGGRYTRSLDEVFIPAAPSGSSVRIVSSGPVQVLGLIGNDLQQNVTAFLAADAPPIQTGALTANQQSLQFNYRIGDSLFSAALVEIGSSGTTLAFSATPNASWIVVDPTSGQTPGNLGVTYNPAGLSPGQYNGSVTVSSASATSLNIPVSLTVTAAPGGNSATGLRFVPVSPCRLVDTRNAAGAFGAPSLAANSARSFAPPQASCGIPAAALAYSVNVTVVPKGPFLGYLTIWPTGAGQPVVSTLNSVDGRVKANAALVPAGAGGALNVFATDATDLVLDINGYFIDPALNSQSLTFYPLPPCRVADTRNPTGGLGGPALAANTARDFPVLGSNCGVPANALAYAMNATVVPAAPLGYLTLWPNGQAQPLVSTLNAPTGGVVANAAIVPAGTNGVISAFATSQTHLVLDINGYFAPAGAANAQRFFPVNPCRVLDTRLNPSGEFAGPVLAAGQSRSYRLPLAGCGLPASSAAYSLNATVVPQPTVGYLSLWPSGASQPLVSTLNAVGDPIVANAAIVPAGTAGGVSTFVTDQTHLILDTNGYFAP